jgi:hypothetical protein
VLAGRLLDGARPFKRLTTKATRRLAVQRSMGSAESDAIATSSVHDRIRGGLNFKGSRIRGD